MQFKRSIFVIIVSLQTDTISIRYLPLLLSPMIIIKEYKYSQYLFRLSIVTTTADMSGRTNNKSRDLTKLQESINRAMSEQKDSQNKDRGNGHYSLRKRKIPSPELAEGSLTIPSPSKAKQVTRKKHVSVMPKSKKESDSSGHSAGTSSSSEKNVQSRPEKRIAEKKKEIRHQSEPIIEQSENSPSSSYRVRRASSILNHSLVNTKSEPLFEESEIIPPRSRRVRRQGSLLNRSIVEQNTKKTKSVKRKSDVSVEALYLQEGAHKRPTVSTSLETVHEDRDTTGRYKRRRITVFDNLYSSSKQKLKFRKDQAKILRKQGVKVPTGKMFTDQDVLSALSHLEDV